MSPNPSDVTVQKRDATQYLSRNQLKFKSDKYELKHLGAVTADADMLVVCGMTIDNPAHDKPVAIPIHREKIVALRATHLIPGTEMMEGVKKAQTQNKTKVDELIIDHFCHKSIFKYLQSVYGLKNMNSLKRKTRSLMDNYMISFFLGDFTTIDEMQFVMRKSVSEGKFQAFDVYGLMIISDKFTDSITNNLIARNTLKIKRSKFNTPMLKTNILGQIKEEMRKCKRPICGLSAERISKFISELANKVEPKALYYLFKTWTQGCQDIEDALTVLKSVSEVTGEELNAARKDLVLDCESWARHHFDEEKADDFIINAFNYCFASVKVHARSIDEVNDKIQEIQEVEEKLERVLSANIANISIDKVETNEIEQETKPVIELEIKQEVKHELAPVDDREKVTSVGQIRNWSDVTGNKSEPTETFKKPDLPSPKLELTDTNDPFAEKPEVDSFFGNNSQIDEFEPKTTSTENGENQDFTTRNPDTACTLRFVVWKAGGLIGRGGSNIRELSDLNDAHVSLDGPSRDELDRVLDPANKRKIDKCFSIEGTQRECLLVAKKACEFLDYNGCCKLNLLVNGEITGCLIGKGRSIKEKLEEECECSYFVDREVKDGSSEKMVKLGGRDGETENVFKLLCKLSDLIIENLADREKKGRPVPGYGENLWKPIVPEEFCVEKVDTEDEGSDAKSESGSVKRKSMSDADGTPSPKKEKVEDADDDFF